MHCACRPLPGLFDACPSTWSTTCAKSIGFELFDQGESLCGPQGRHNVFADTFTSETSSAARATTAHEVYPRARVMERLARRCSLLYFDVVTKHDYDAMHGGTGFADDYAIERTAAEYKGRRRSGGTHEDRVRQGRGTVQRA